MRRISQEPSDSLVYHLVINYGIDPERVLPKGLAYGSFTQEKLTEQDRPEEDLTKFTYVSELEDTNRRAYWKSIYKDHKASIRVIIARHGHSCDLERRSEGERVR
jgi:hypothetical protein